MFRMTFVRVARCPSPMATRLSTSFTASHQLLSMCFSLRTGIPLGTIPLPACTRERGISIRSSLAMGRKHSGPITVFRGPGGRKGFRQHIDSYSAFFENDRTTPTGLGGYLKERGLSRIFLAGLAYDYCVGYSALDARQLGFEAVIVRDACRAIDLDGSVATIESEFAKAGAALIESAVLGF
jgi:hypothetical protein